MYGLIGQMIAVSNKRDELIEILLDGTKEMPGYFSCVIAKDNKNNDALWITEVWFSQDSHAASLSLASVKAAIVKWKPLIAGFAQRFEPVPVGGSGLGASQAPQTLKCAPFDFRS
jgi:quinol monooxygenase YgiN